MSTRRLPGRVLALTPGDLRDENAADFARRARDAVAAGLDSILVREPELSDRATLELALALREILGSDGWLGIHDRVHLAAAAGADGVHLGFRSLAIDATRAIVADDVAIGYSAHAHDQLDAWSGADYLVYGPVYETPSKQGLLEPVGIAGLGATVRATSIPIWALGGIDAARADEVSSSGCRGIAVRGALFGAHDARAAWRELARAAHGGSTRTNTMERSHQLPRVYELLPARHAWSHWGDFGDVLVHGLVTSRAYAELPLRIERTGPYVPPLMLPGPVDVVVTDAVRARLQELVRELRFREVVKARIVRVDWHTWNAAGLEPRYVPESNEPADYVLAAPHDAELAESLGKIWEVVPDLDMEIEDDEGRLCPENYYGQPFVRGRLCGGRNYVSEEFRAALEEVVPGHLIFRPARAVRRLRVTGP